MAVLKFLTILQIVWTFYILLKFLTILKILIILKIFDHFKNFWSFYKFLSILKIFDYFLQFLAIFTIFGQFKNLFTIFKSFGHFYNFWPFKKILTNLGFCFGRGFVLFGDGFGDESLNESLFDPTSGPADLRVFILENFIFQKTNFFFRKLFIFSYIDKVEISVEVDFSTRQYLDTFSKLAE